MKLIAAVISLRSFWQKWDFISVDKCHVNTPPKWNPSERNVCACKYFIKIKIADQKIKRKKRNLFCSQWKLVQTELTSWRNEISFRVSCTYPLKTFWGWKVQTQKITIAMIFFLTYKRITMRSVYILHQLIPTSIRHQKLRLTCRESSLVDFLHHVKLRENY